MNKIVIITSSSLRHLYFAKKLNQQFKKVIAKIYVEITNDFNSNYSLYDKTKDELGLHFDQRHNSEIDFFSDASDILNEKQKIRTLKRGEINDQAIFVEIKKIEPDLILTYGCSIIRKPLISIFKKKIINIHLGLSPYYLGAGTNFHALVNNEFQFFGYSIIYMDEGIDTGEIIHQSRGDFLINDTPHSAGNRLIKKMVHDLIKLIINYTSIKKKPKIKTEYKSKIFKIKDSDSDKVNLLYKTFESNLKSFIKKSDLLDQEYPIVKQNFFNI